MKRNLKGIFLVVGFFLVFAATTLFNTELSHAGNSSVDGQTIQLESIEWRANSSIAGVQSAIAVGDPSDTGLYALLGKMAVRTVFPAHVHPDNRITTVISGVMYYGVGEQFNPNNALAYPAGSIVYTAAGTPHFMWSKDGEVIAQETGFGPTGITFAADN